MLADVDSIFRDKIPFGVVILPHQGGYLFYSAFRKEFARIPSTNVDLGLAMMELERDRFFTVPVVQPDRTVRVTLIVTTDCNLRCKYCYVAAGDHPEYMPLWLARKAIGFAVPPEAEELFISFFGGEPTLNFEVIRGVIQGIESSSLQFRPIISTNGVVPDDVLQFLIEKDFIIKISLDGPPDIQDQYRVFADGRPTSEIIESTLRTLTREGIQPRVRVTLTNETLVRVEEIIEYLASVGVNIVHMELVSQRGRAREQGFERPTPDEYVEAIVSAIEHCRRKGIQFVTSSLLRLFAPATHYCTSLSGRKFVFTPDGLITSCIETQNYLTAPPQFVLGRYVPEKGTYGCDWSRTVPDIRNIMRKCKQCPLVSVCCGGCPIRNFNITGKISEVDDWQCEVRKKLLSKVIVDMYNESLKAKEETDQL